VRSQLKRAPDTNPPYRTSWKQEYVDGAVTSRPIRKVSRIFMYQRRTVCTVYGAVGL
jgi:hypothetical protein